MSNPIKLSIKCAVGFSLAVTMLLFAVITNAGCQESVYQIVKEPKPPIKITGNGSAIITKSVRTNSLINFLHKAHYSEYLLTVHVTADDGRKWWANMRELVDGSVDLRTAFAIIYDRQNTLNVQLAEQEQVPSSK